MSKELELKDGVQIYTLDSGRGRRTGEPSFDLLVQVRKNAKGRVTFVRESGKVFESEEEKSKKEVKVNELSFKALNAVRVLSLLTRHVFQSVDDGSAQDAYYTELERQINWDGYPEDDIRECFRLAAAFLGNEEVSARDSARLIVELDPRSKNFSEEAVNNNIGILANEIRGYYPANFPKSKIGPWSR